MEPSSRRTAPAYSAFSALSSFSVSAFFAALSSSATAFWAAFLAVAIASSTTSLRATGSSTREMTAMGALSPLRGVVLMMRV